MASDLKKMFGRVFEATKSSIKELSFPETISDKREIQERRAIKVVVISGHQFMPVLLKEFTYCAQCKEFIWLNPKSPINSLRNAQCQLCKLTVHSKCAQNVEKICRKSSSISQSYEQTPLNLGHNFKSNLFCAYCDHCGTSKLLTNLLKCDNQKCGMTVHSDCRDLICFECGYRSQSSDINQNTKIMTKDGLQIEDVNKTRSTILDDFEVLDSRLGEGSFSKIYLVKTRRNNKRYAMKIVDKANISVRNDPESSQLEWQILEMGRSYPYLAAGSCCFQTKTKLIYLLEYGPGGDLLYQLERRKDNGEGPFSEDQVRFYAAEIILALIYLHKRHIVYRDLKPENVILDKLGHCKLIDFGMAKNLIRCPTMKTNTFCGTQFYLAPEMIERQSYSYSVDWWALGVSMYELLFGTLPFPFFDELRDDDDQEIYDLICNTTIKYPGANHKSREVIDLLQHLLIRNPELRIGCQIVEGSEQAVKIHPFFAKAKVPGQIVPKDFWEAVADRTISPPAFRLRTECETNDNYKYDNSMSWKMFDSDDTSSNKSNSADHDFHNFSQYGESFQDVNNIIVDLSNITIK